MILQNHLFLENANQLIILCCIVFVAGIIRGCIGFGFSALVVASTSFWLDMKYVVMMVIILEVMASISMLKSIRSDVDYKLFRILAVSGVVTSFLGVWLLANTPQLIHQTLLSLYLGCVALSVLFHFQFRKPVNDFRLYVVGSIAGFYNGFAGIGGVFIAAMLTSSRIQVQNIRATMVVYFFLAEATFFVSAYIMGIFSQKAVVTALVLIAPMQLGIYLGTKLFGILSENTLKQAVLFALLILSVTGLIKTFL